MYKDGRTTTFLFHFPTGRMRGQVGATNYQAKVPKFTIKIKCLFLFVLYRTFELTEPGVIWSFTETTIYVFLLRLHRCTWTQPLKSFSIPSCSCSAYMPTRKAQRGKNSYPSPTPSCPPGGQLITRRYVYNFR